MIELRDTVAIDAPPREVWSWLETLPEHYLAWHPDHVAARWVRGQSFVPGSVMEATEILHGRPHRLRMGTRAPVVGPTLDRLLRLALGARIAAVEEHQREEGANLKALLERR